MSRVGKNPVQVPESVSCVLAESILSVKGKLGELSLALAPEVSVAQEGATLVVSPKSQDKRSISLWGTTRALIANAVRDVNDGFTKRLEINGVGYRAALKGNELNLQLGFSHDINMTVPAGIDVKCEKPTLLAITGYNRQQVGEFAAKIRSLRLPEPYKGKGIKYDDEVILRKEGKKK